jgi:hypothetical protein
MTTSAPVEAVFRIYYIKNGEQLFQFENYLVPELLCGRRLSCRRIFQRIPLKLLRGERVLIGKIKGRGLVQDELIS